MRFLHHATDVKSKRVLKLWKTFGSDASPIEVTIWITVDISVINRLQQFVLQETP